MGTPYNTTKGSASVSTTKISLITGTSTLTAQTTAGGVEGLIDDKGNMAPGDQFLVEVTEKVNGGTTRSVFTGYMTGVQSGHYKIPRIDVDEGWSVNIQQTAGASARTFGWSVKQHVGDVNALTVGSGAITSTAIAANAIGATQIAGGAITAAKFATDAVDANALAATAVAEIQTGLATTTALNSVAAQATDIQGRLPATLDGGNMRSAVEAVAANAITSAGIAANAIGATQIAGGAITAAKFATDAVDANALAATAVAEIQTGLATTANVSSVSAQVTGVQTDVTTLTGRLTATRAGLLDNLTHLNADVNTLATATQLTSVGGQVTGVQTDVTTLTGRLTSTRAGLLDNLTNLDATISSREPNGAAATVGTTILADTANIKSRLPAALDGSGNMPSAVQSLTGGALSAIAGAIMNVTVEAGATTYSLVMVLRGMASLMLGKSSGYVAGLPRWRNLNDTKDVISATETDDGRTVVALDLS